MPRNSQNDEKSSKDSKSQKPKKSSTKTSNAAKELTISTSGDEDYIPTTPKTSPGNQMLNNQINQYISEAYSAPTPKQKRAAIEAGIEKEGLFEVRMKSKIVTRRSKKVSFAEAVARKQVSGGNIIPGDAAAPSTIASSNEVVTEGKTTGKIAKTKDLKTTIEARTEQWNKSSGSFDIVDLVDQSGDIEAPAVKKPKTVDLDLGKKVVAGKIKKAPIPKNDPEGNPILLANPDLPIYERRKARYDSNLALSKALKQQIADLNLQNNISTRPSVRRDHRGVIHPYDDDDGRDEKLHLLSSKLDGLKGILAMDKGFLNPFDAVLRKDEQDGPLAQLQKLERKRFRAQEREARLRTIEEDERRRVDDHFRRAELQNRRMAQNRIMAPRQRRLDDAENGAQEHYANQHYPIAYQQIRELNHARNVQAADKFVNIKELDLQKKASEKKLQEMLEETEKNTWSYKQKNKFQKKISRPGLNSGLAIEPVIGSNNLAGTENDEEVSSEPIPKIESKSGPLKRRHSLNLFYKHSNADVKTINVCSFTISADVILMARSKNSDFDDVCIPLHKAQLLENVPYFKAMFANNWRENQVGSDSKSYGISDFLPDNQEMDESVRDQPSTSKPLQPVDNGGIEENVTPQTESDKLSTTISASISNFSAESQVLYFKSIYSADIDLNQPSEDLLETFQLADFLNDAELLTHLEPKIREMISLKNFSTMWQLKNETIRETCLEKLHLFAAVNTGSVLELEEHSIDMNNLMKSVYQNSDLTDILDFFNRTVSTIGFPVHMKYLVELIDDRLVYEFLDKFESVDEFRNFVMRLQFEKVNESIGIFVFIVEYDQKDLKNHREWQIKFLKTVTMTFASFGDNKVDSELIGRIFQEIDAVNNISWKFDHYE